MSNLQIGNGLNVQEARNFPESLPGEFDEHADPTSWLLQENQDDFAALEDLITSKAIFVPLRLTDNWN